jgi:hypothetical protein
MMPRKNDWASRFAFSRRALDRAYCQAAEHAIALEEAQTAKNERPPSAVNSEAPEAISFLDEERKRIARAFGRPVK